MSQQQSLLRCVYKALPRQPLCLAPFSRVRVHTIRLAGTHGYPPSKPRRGLHTAATATSSMVSSGSTLTGHSGRHYAIERVLQKKDNSPLGVYVAKYASSRGHCSRPMSWLLTFVSRSCATANEKVILKDVPDFKYLQDIYGKIDTGSHHLRLPQDTIPDRSMYVYKFFTDDFLGLAAKTGLPLETTKRILKRALQGIAALHDQNIVHNGTSRRDGSFTTVLSTCNTDTPLRYKGK